MVSIFRLIRIGSNKYNPLHYSHGAKNHDFDKKCLETILQVYVAKEKLRLNKYILVQQIVIHLKFLYESQVRDLLLQKKRCHFELKYVF